MIKQTSKKSNNNKKSSFADVIQNLEIGMVKKFDTDDKPKEEQFDDKNNYKIIIQDSEEQDPNTNTAKEAHTSRGYQSAPWDSDFGDHLQGSKRRSDGAMS